jgi:hypothetical protein
MTEGTKSYLIGCHSWIVHPLSVVRAWRQEYGTWPNWWQTVGIVCHDIGVCGREYLTDDGAKIGHWRRGARLAAKIVYCISGCSELAGRAYLFCAGHCPDESGYPASRLFRADKRSPLAAPMWWLWLNYYVEWHGRGIAATPPPEWRRHVAANMERERPLGNHELYMRHRRLQGGA